MPNKMSLKLSMRTSKTAVVSLGDPTFEEFKQTELFSGMQHLWVTWRRIS